LIDFVNLSQGP